MEAQVADGGVGPNFLGLPEGCIATILSFTTPQDVCRQSLVSSVFKSACNSDTVWSAFLPSNYKSILALALHGSCSSPSLRHLSSLKDIFFSLCDDPVLLDDGKMSFLLDRRSGKKCIMLSARTLFIEWGDTPVYWSWKPSSDSRFADVAELIDVCWLEIRGKISSGLLSPGTHYAAYLVFKFAPSAHGFGGLSVEVGAGFEFIRDEGGDQGCRVYLTNQNNYGVHLDTDDEDGDGEGDDRVSEVYVPVWRRGVGDLPTERRDGWSEVELGEFFVEEGEDREVEMRVLETKAGHWKGGLIVEGIEIRPKQKEEGLTRTTME